MGRRTPLYDQHVALGARTVDFGGWDMPVNYGSQIEEHHSVRRDAGMFDVSHMCVVDLHGASTRAFLSRLVANDVGKLRVAFVQWLWFGKFNERWKWQRKSCGDSGSQRGDSRSK